MAKRTIRAGWVLCVQCDHQAADRRQGEPVCADCIRAADAASKAAAKVAWEAAA